jgi:hypothetical protein
MSHFIASALILRVVLQYYKCYHYYIAFYCGYKLEDLGKSSSAATLNMFEFSIGPRDMGSYVLPPKTVKPYQLTRSV